MLTVRNNQDLETLLDKLQNLEIKGIVQINARYVIAQIPMGSGIPARLDDARTLLKPEHIYEGPMIQSKNKLHLLRCSQSLMRLVLTLSHQIHDKPHLLRCGINPKDLVILKYPGHKGETNNYSVNKVRKTDRYGFTSSIVSPPNCNWEFVTQDPNNDMNHVIRFAGFSFLRIPLLNLTKFAEARIYPVLR